MIIPYRKYVRVAFPGVIGLILSALTALVYIPFKILKSN